MKNEEKNGPIKENKRKPYKVPSISSEDILEAGLGPVCNGMANGGRKGTFGEGCSVLKT